MTHARLQGLRVAVVDDEESVRKALCRLLGTAGMQVEAYASGEEFLASLAHSRPACALIDLHMPLMGGFEVRTHLVREGIDLAVIVVTGHDKPESRARARELGVQGYLCKPLEASVLFHAIASATGR